ncbi:hypothetical protein FHS25_001820 [Rhizobium laguerreae]|uniref:Sigma-70 family RNA polymerase sigma factor n=2 Tax=Rhizobium laguerreae TaxID=1076926 RepID=A0ABR6G646_9HYPH|nr:hypothetical protein [Rhizobium laguerreae]
MKHEASTRSGGNGEPRPKLKKDQAMSIQAEAAPAQQNTHMNALELFRTGRDYIEIAAILGRSVPSVETEIHTLRSAEKGDTAQQDHDGSKIRRFPRRSARPGAPVNFARRATEAAGLRPTIHAAVAASTGKGTSHG